MRLEGQVLRGRTIAPGAVGVEDGRVAADAGGRRVAVPPGWTICGGFVDVQVNGFGGAEVGEDPDEVAAVAAALPAVGVTAFCPTLVSRDEAGYARAARAIAAARPAPGSARVLGTHLEGPFLAPTSSRSPRSFPAGWRRCAACAARGPSPRSATPRPTPPPAAPPSPPGRA